MYLGSITSRCSGKINEPALTPPKERLDASDFYCWFQPIRLPPADFRLATLSQKLSYVIRVEKMNAAFERVLETFQIENLKDLQQEALEKLVSGSDVCVIQPTGSGKSLNFSVSPDCVRRSKTVVKCEINRSCDFSSGFSYARPSAVPEVCWNQH